MLLHHQYNPLKDDWIKNGGTSTTSTSTRRCFFIRLIVGRKIDTFHVPKKGLRYIEGNIIFLTNMDLCQSKKPRVVVTTLGFCQQFI